MTAHERAELECDHHPCNEWFTSLEWAEDDVRKEAARFGWTFVGGRDLCPDHSQKAGEP
jgi:hypothetical protein